MSRSTALPASSGVGRVLSEFPFLYRALRTPVRGVLERWFRLRVEGAEHLPECGPYLVAANHHNYLDGVVLGVSVPAPITFLVMPRVWRATPLHPAFHRHIGSIPLNLDRADVGALRQALAALERGRAGGAGGHPRHVGGPARPALLRAARDAAGRALRPAAALLAERCLRPRDSARRDRAYHGRHRGAAAVTKTWGGRFSQGADPAAERFTGSLAFDRRLWPQDVAGSIAWARALARARLLTDAERDAIVKGLEAVRAELQAGTFPFRPELEDIHTNVERRLVELIGDVGGKLHTGRSRNDQIALDERMYLKDAIVRAREGLRAVQAALVARAGETTDAPMPGYTHLQRAQPILLAHHLLAYVFMFERDRERMAGCAARADRLPLGAAALAGTAFPIDREALARDLGFAGVTPNSLDAVSDRDYILEYLAAAAIAGMHLSRLAADLTLWATAEFGFVEFADAFATGSSIMPQKKNPDVAELVRGKSGRLSGHLVAGLTTMKGLPPSYNSDLQEDKEPFFDSVDTLEAVLGVLPPLLGSLTFRTDRMRAANRKSTRLNSSH